MEGIKDMQKIIMISVRRSRKEDVRLRARYIFSLFDFPFAELDAIGNTNFVGADSPTSGDSVKESATFQHPMSMQ